MTSAAPPATTRITTTTPHASILPYPTLPCPGARVNFVAGGLAKARLLSPWALVAAAAVAAAAVTAAIAAAAAAAAVAN